MTNRIVVAAVFLAGCAVGGVSSQLVVPKANAQQAATLTKWEHFCPERVDTDDFPAFANRAGSEGWELVVRHLENGKTYACFKRPKM